MLEWLQWPVFSENNISGKKCRDILQNLKVCNIYEINPIFFPLFLATNHFRWMA